MLVSILLLAVVGLAFYVWLIRADVKYLRRRLERLEDLNWSPRTLPPDMPSAAAPPDLVAAGVMARPAARVAKTTNFDVTAAPDRAPEQEVQSDQPAEGGRSAQFNFENLVGGQLPIWIGGIALVFAGFFLVRYTIEAGLFGPAARSVTATLFAILLIAISLFGGKLPKIGNSFAADPRVGQSLAGAGIATLYGTLYMAVEIYGLLGLGAAFILVVLTTAIAFVLALRHGPPTALMGLVGGFVAPWVAGMGANNLPSLLLYLAVFIAALFGLAIWRRWLWLLVLASGGGLLWSLAMLFAANSNLALLGGVIAVSAGGALLAAQRFDQQQGIWSQLARFAPMTIALVQLAMLMPKMEFSVIGWMLYFAVSALTIALAWRDRLLLPLVAGALLLAMGPLGSAWDADGAIQRNIAAAIAIILLFSVSAFVRARQTDDAAQYWAMIGFTAPGLCWLVTAIAAQNGNDNLWASLAALAALPAMWTAWEWHQKSRAPEIQKWATGVAAVMLWFASALLFREDWLPATAATVALSVAAWAHVTQGVWERRISLIPLGFAIFAATAYSYQFLDAISASLWGEGAITGRLPMISDAARATLIPALLVGAITWPQIFAAGPRTRKIAFAVGALGIAAFFWLLGKQVAYIISPSDFICLGFAERAVITHIILGLGWLAFTKMDERPQWPILRPLGLALFAIGMLRVLWFDLIIHNPLIDPQAVGPVPVANLASMHFAALSAYLWIVAAKLPARWPIKGASLGMMIVAMGVTVRQSFQGTLLTGGGMSNVENYAYSAAFMLLSLAWLVFGIRKGVTLLRFAGLLLLTVVTFKVFLIDAAALEGLLRIISFLGLGIALIGIGWAYGRVMRIKNSKVTAG